MKKYLISIVLLCLFSIAFGAGNTLSGKLLDISGNPVYSTQVTLKSKTDESVKFVVNTPMPPDYQPAYRFESLSAGEYTLSAFGDGSKSTPADITIGNIDVEHDIIFSPDDNIVKIMVNVYNGDSYQSVPNVTIQCYKAEVLTAEAITNDMGSYSFFGMSPGKYKFVATASGFKTTELTKEISKYDNFVTIRMPEDLGETVNVSGTIKRNNDVNYNGVVVSIRNEASGKEFYSNASADGTYSINEVQLGNSTFSLVEAPNMTIATPTGVVDITKVEDGDFIQNIVAEQTSISLKGFVYINNNTGINGVNVDIKLGDNIVKSTQTDYMGAWIVDHISQSGEYEIIVAHVGYTPITKNVTINVQETINNGGNPIIIEAFRLEPVAIQITLNGGVEYYDLVTYENIKVANATVELWSSDGAKKFGSTTSNSEGAFTILFDGFTNTTYKITCICTGYENYENTKTIYSDNENITITLQKPAAVIYPIINLIAVQTPKLISVDITWEIDPLASEYTIFRFSISRKTADDAYFGQIGIVMAGDEMRYCDENVEIGKEYCYVVDVEYRNPSGTGYYPKVDAKCVTITEPVIPKKYAITITNPEEGTVEVRNGETTITNGMEVEDGITLTISAEPIDPKLFILKTIMVDGVAIDGNSVIVSKSITISATFEELKGINEVKTNSIIAWSNGRNIQLRIVDFESVASDRAIVIYNIAGQIIKQLNVTQPEVSIPINEAGVYIVRLGNTSNKVIVQ